MSTGGHPALYILMARGLLERALALPRVPPETRQALHERLAEIDRRSAASPT